MGKKIFKGKKYLEIRGEKDLNKAKNDIHNDNVYMNNGIDFLANILTDYLLRDR